MCSVVANAQILLSESFEGTFPPTGWALVNAGTGNPWTQSTLATAAKSGVRSMLYTYEATGVHPANAWAFTSALNLTMGTNYRISYWYKARSASFPEKLKVTIGTAQTVAAATTTLATHDPITSTVYAESVITYMPPSTGTYYLGFHAFSGPDEFDLNVDSVVVQQFAGCTGTPTPGTAAGPAEACNNSNVTLTLTGTTSAAGISFQWQSSPLGANTFTNISGATSAGLTIFQTAPTDYKCIVTCSNGGASAPSNTVSVAQKTTGCPPANDEACGAVALTLNGPQDCGNSATATSVGDPAFGGGCSTPNNTLWYKYTPAATGRVSIVFNPPAGAAGTVDTLRGWAGIFVSSTACPSLTLADSTLNNTGVACQGFGASGRIADTISANVTAGKTYYIMLDGNAGDVGLYCIKLISPPAPPASCATNITPANNATGVTSVTMGVALTWSAVAGAAGYDIYFGTVNPPTTNLGTLNGATTVTITGTAYNTKYYWYVVPRNAGGTATGCVSSTTAFTTELAPANCVPVYSTGCSLGDAFTNFKVIGETGGVNIDQTSTCGTGGYQDHTAGGGFPFLVPGTSYPGSATMEYTGDYMTIWIDYNDDGYYTDNERVINNLRAAGSGIATPFTMYIPSTATAGSHKMRIRSVDYGTVTAPTVPTDPCASYVYGETEDYTVLIVAGPAAAYTVSDGTANACLTGGKITIDPASNNNNVFVPILDATGKIIASVNANGTNLGTVNIGEYINSGAVRISANSIKYLDRNIIITPQRQPVDVPVTVRLYLKATELAALVAADPTVTGVGSLNVTKTAQACNAVAGAGTLFSQTGNGLLGTDSYVQISIPSFSSFYLHGGTVALPVNYADLKGIRNGNKVELTWVTQSETNNRSFEIQRSADGRSFTAMGAVNSKAVGGNSVSPISYNFTDVLPLVVTNYYRLKQTDIDGKVSYSNTVLVKGLKPTLFSLNTIFPNPATERVMAALQSPFADNITLMVTDITGKIIKRQVANMVIGDNLVTVDVAALPSGSYLLKAVCKNGCETAVRKFTKQ